MFQQMVGAMALLSSPMSMPTGVVEESCIREHPSPSGSGSADERVSANLLANAQQHQQQQHSVSKRRRVAADTAAQRRRHRQQRTAQHRLSNATGRRPSRTNRRDNSEDDEENDEDEEADEEDDDDDERDADADVEDDAIIDSRREPQQQMEKQKPVHPQHHQLPQQQQQQLYSLRWHDFQSSILSSFRHLRDVEDFVDVTLACDGKSFTAHKMVLSACSPYFRHLLKVSSFQYSFRRSFVRTIKEEETTTHTKKCVNLSLKTSQQTIDYYTKSLAIFAARLRWNYPIKKRKGRSKKKKMFLDVRSNSTRVGFLLLRPSRRHRHARNGRK